MPKAQAAACHDRSAALAQPARSAGLLHFGQGREIFQEGGDPGVYFTVVSGMVRTCKFRADGRRQIDGFHGPGDVFGFELAQAQSLSAEAVSNCTVASRRWRNLGASGRNVPHHLFSHAMRSLARTQAHALLLGRRGAVEKVAAFLAEQAAQSPDPALITLEMTRQDIADYLGLTIETVSRTLSQFERASLIGMATARQVRLHDAAALQKLRD